MALTRKVLEELGISEAQVEAVLAAQAEAQAEGDAGAQGEESAEEEAVDWQGRYEQLRLAFEGFRQAQAAREQLERVKAAYTALLKGANVDERRWGAILRATDLTGLALDADGSLMDAERLTEAIRRDWADFIVTSSRRGATVPTPPGLGGARRSRDEIMAIADSRERQRAIAENHELFGF